MCGVCLCGYVSELVGRLGFVGFRAQSPDCTAIPSANEESFAYTWAYVEVCRVRSGSAGMICIGVEFVGFLFKSGVLRLCSGTAFSSLTNSLALNSRANKSLESYSWDMAGQKALRTEIGAENTLQTLAPTADSLVQSLNEVSE